MAAPRGNGHRTALVGALSMVAIAAGCGPIEYVNQVTLKASASVDAARAAQADKYSPYYYTLAKEYLHKAREEAASADYQAANRFGRKAERAAREAKAEALARAGKPIEQFHPNFGKDADSKPTPAGMAPLTDEPEGDGGGTAEPDTPDTDDSSDRADPDSDDEVPPGIEGGS